MCVCCMFECKFICICVGVTRLRIFPCVVNASYLDSMILGNRIGRICVRRKENLCWTNIVKKQAS